VPAADFKGNPREAVWLPNAAVADAWMEYVKNGTVGDSSPPSAPFDLKVVAKPDQGNEITWDAEADFESGIGGFIILPRRQGPGAAARGAAGPGVGEAAAALPRDLLSRHTGGSDT
jgi:hypothetical protein